MNNLRKPPSQRRTGIFRTSAAALALHGGGAVLSDSAHAGIASEPSIQAEDTISELDFEASLEQAERLRDPSKFWSQFGPNKSSADTTKAWPVPRLRALLAQTPAKELSSFWNAVRYEPNLPVLLGVEALQDAAYRAYNGADVLVALNALNHEDREATQILVDALDTRTMDQVLQSSDRWHISQFWQAVLIPEIGSKVTQSQVRRVLEKTQRNNGEDERVLVGIRTDKYSSWSRHIAHEDLLRYLDRGPLAENVQEEFLRGLADASLAPLWGAVSRDYLAGSYAPVATARSIEKRYEGSNAQLPPGAQDALRGMVAWQKRNFETSRKMPEKEQYINMVRIVNHAHVFPHADRAKLVEGMSAEHLYTLITLGEAELYVLGTSAFRDQLAPALLKAVRKQWQGDFKAFLQEADPSSEYLAQFLRVAATFAKSDDFFGKDSSDLPYLLRPVLERIDVSEGGLHVATVLLDLLMPGSGSSGGVLSNPFTTTVEDLLAEEFGKADGERRLVLGTIGALYAQYAPHDSRFAAMKEAYGGDVKIESLSLDQLFTRDEDGRLVHRARMYFFPGADGEASYANFVQQFKGWDCSEQNGYRECTRSIGDRRVSILANNPSHDLKSANARIDSKLDDKQVHTLIMRGHSSSVEQFIDMIRDKDYKPAVVHMGACGAFSHLSNIYHAIKKLVHIISTRGTGSMTVNDPLLAYFFEDILSLPLTKEAPFRWDQFAKKMKAHFSGSGEKVRAYFDAYQLPHHNYAAILLHRVTLATQAAGAGAPSNDPTNRQRGL